MYLYLCSGLGNSILQLCAVVEVQQTFSSSAVVMAQMLSYIGFSLGGIVAGIIMPSLLLTFGWRGTMALEGAVMLHGLVLASAFVSHYHVKVVDQYLKSDIDDSDSKKKSVNQPARLRVGSVLRETCDFSLFGNVTFLMFCLGRIGVWFAFQCVYAHTPSRAVEVGMTLQQGTLFLSFVSIGTFLCRPIYAAVTHFCKVSNIISAIVCAFVSAVILMAIAFTEEFNSLIAMYIALGMSLGMYCLCKKHSDAFFNEISCAVTYHIHTHTHTHTYTQQQHMRTCSRTYAYSSVSALAYLLHVQPKNGI